MTARSVSSLTVDVLPVSGDMRSRVISRIIGVVRACMKVVLPDNRSDEPLEWIEAPVSKRGFVFYAN